MHENVKEFMQGFRYDAHPMGMLLASVGALSTFYPEAAAIKDPESRYIQVIRLLAKMPTLAAFSYRHNRGMPYVYPDNDLSYPGNFLSMIYKIAELKYEPDPRSSMRSTCSSSCTPITSRTARPAPCAASAPRRSTRTRRWRPAWRALRPLHGGANEAVLRMLQRIETKENIPDFIKGVKDGNERLMGFGHRVYKNFDPRAKIIKKAADEVFEVTGRNPLLDIALELEKIALDDDYFVSASCTRTWTSTRASSTRRSGCRSRCSRCCSRSRARPAGSRSGWR